MSPLRGRYGPKIVLKNIFKRRSETASLPEGKRIYAIGDIHGRDDMLATLLQRINDDHAGAKGAQLIFLGDYVDRGPDTRAVLDRLIALRQTRPDTVFLKGNHEAIMLDYLDEPEGFEQWLGWGGEETLESYGVDCVGKTGPAIVKDFLAAAPPAHLDFLRALKLTHVEGDYLFVHAGVRPGRPLDKQVEEDLIWIRGRFHNAKPEERPEQVVVHGHTPTSKPVDEGWRIDVDTGACYGGALTAVVLEGTTRRFLSVRD